MAPDDDRSKSEIADERNKRAEAFQEFSKTWNPRAELVAAARAGDESAAARCDALFENWRKV